jgi:hypothetical protein
MNLAGMLALLIIRWGPDASSDMLRQCARCTVCGHKGAALQGPGWKNGPRRVGAVPGRGNVRRAGWLTQHGGSEVHTL